MPHEDWRERLICPFCKDGFTAKSSDIKTLAPGTPRPYIRDVPYFYRLDMKCSVASCKSICRILMAARGFLTNQTKVEILDQLLKRQERETLSSTKYVDRLTCSAGHTIIGGVDLSSSEEVRAFFDAPASLK